MFPFLRPKQRLVSLGFVDGWGALPTTWKGPEPGVYWANWMTGNSRTWTSATRIVSTNWINRSGV